MKNSLLKLLIALCLLALVTGCSSPAEKAEKYYQKGMALLDKEPGKAKLEFQNALQLKKSMTKAMYGLALVAEREGDWKGTFALMREVVEQDPKNIDAQVKLGQIFLAGGKLDYALEKSKIALELNKTNVAALNLYAAIQLKSNNQSGAIEYANLALAQDPSNADSYVVLANASLIAKDEAKAIEYFDKALAKNEKNLAVQFLKVKALDSLSKTQDADQTYQKMLELFPETPFVRKSYAQFLVKNNRKDDAEQQLRAIAQMTPNDFYAKLDIVRFVLVTKGASAGRLELENFVKKQPETYELAFALIDLYKAQNDGVAEDKLLSQIAKQAGDTANGFKARSFGAYKLMKAGKTDEATKILNEILETDKSNTQALTLRASIALQAKHYDAAISDLRTVLRDSPEASGSALMLAFAYENSGSSELAEEYYIKAFETSKLSARYGVPYSEFLMRRKQPARAEKVLEGMLAAHPADVSVIRALAQFKIAKGDYAGAQELADKVKNISANNVLSDEISGAISSNKNDLEGTIKALKAAHEASPNDLKAILRIINAYVVAGKTPEAITFIENILKSKPDNIDAKLIKGQLYASSGNEKGAIQVYSDVIQSSPNTTLAYQHLALMQLRAKNFTEAEKTINQGLKLAAKDFGLKVTLASVYEASGQFDSAIKVYEGIIVDRPDSEIVANNLASLLLDNRSEKADFERAYKLAHVAENSKLPQFLDTLGWASYKVGKYEEAEKNLKIAIEDLPKASVFHYHLAKVYIATNNIDLAKRELQKAIDFSANYESELKADAVKLLNLLQLPS